MLAGVIFTSSVGLTVGLTAPFVLTRSVLPYMATPKHKVRRALAYILANHPKPAAAATTTTTTARAANGSSGMVFVDLGSGDGEAVYQAAKLGYHAIGLELNFTLWAFASLRRQVFWTRYERQHSQFLWRNFFAYPLRDAHTVMIFGVTPLMTSMSQKLAAECQPGTFILSYRFAIPLAYDDDQPDLLKADIIYDDQEMRIYQSKNGTV